MRSEKGSAAFANDVVWTIALALGLEVLVLGDVDSIDAFVSVWAIGAAVGAIFGVFQSGVVPKPGRVMSWRREHADIAPQFAAEALIVSGAQYATVTSIGLVAGIAVVGTVRAGNVLR